MKRLRFSLVIPGLTRDPCLESPAGPNRLGQLLTEQHYGSVDIDWAAGTLQLALKDVHGAVQRSQLIRINELKAPS